MVRAADGDEEVGVASCPGRGAAFFMPLRRARTEPTTGTRYGPGRSAPLRKSCALRCVRGTSYPGSLGGTGDVLLPAVAPPSIGSVMPVTHRDSSLARYSAP
ncbi:MAG: hypothetical protein QOI05_568 [Bradyrhizobium sp.]|nr:hypothetical protein [Bradyrhizobium sp.]